MSKRKGEAEKDARKPDVKKQYKTQPQDLEESEEAEEPNLVKEGSGASATGEKRH